MKTLTQAVRLGVLILAVGGSFCQQAAAAPFCISNQVIAPLCIYYDAQECQQEANRQGAECSANPTELRLTRGVGQYCVVTSGQVSVCAYADNRTCALDAARQHGACVIAPQIAPAATPDPYSTTVGQ
ncbi:hypothetical protein [Rhodopila sp.]|uniref:hypothetical protein n=1 Tax=Rhodopila sp. TaxID=2480087 RepID=UPI003D127F8D